MAPAWLMGVLWPHQGDSPFSRPSGRGSSTSQRPPGPPSQGHGTLAPGPWLVTHQVAEASRDPGSVQDS